MDQHQLGEPTRSMSSKVEPWDACCGCSTIAGLLHRLGPSLRGWDNGWETSAPAAPSCSDSAPVLCNVRAALECPGSLKFLTAGTPQLQRPWHFKLCEEWTDWYQLRTAYIRGCPRRGRSQKWSLPSRHFHWLDELNKSTRSVLKSTSANKLMVVKPTALQALFER